MTPNDEQVRRAAKALWDSFDKIAKDPTEIIAQFLAARDARRSEMEAARERVIEAAKVAKERFFHHWKHGGISRDNRFHQETAMWMRDLEAKLAALDAKEKP